MKDLNMLLSCFREMSDQGRGSEQRLQTLSDGWTDGRRHQWDLLLHPNLISGSALISMEYVARSLLRFIGS